MTKDLLFFVVLKDPNGVRLELLRLDHETQKNLSELFQAQAKAFLDGREVVDYEPGYMPDDSSLQRISDYELPDGIKAALKSPDSVSEVDLQSLGELPIRAILGVESATLKSRRLFFQLFDSRQIIGKKYSLIFSENHLSQLTKPGITIKDALTAAVVDGELRFESEEVVRRFLDLDQYFKEATDTEMEKFFAHSSFTAQNQALLLQFSDRWVRKKVASIHARKLLENVDLNKLTGAAARYGLQLTIEKHGKKQKIEIPADKAELKKFLRLLAQDYLDCSITGDSFQVSSKRRLS